MGVKVRMAIHKRNVCMATVLAWEPCSFGSRVTLGAVLLTPIVSEWSAPITTPSDFQRQLAKGLNFAVKCLRKGGS